MPQYRLSVVTSGTSVAGNGGPYNSVTVQALLLPHGDPSFSGAAQRVDMSRQL